MIMEIHYPKESRATTIVHAQGVKIDICAPSPQVNPLSTSPKTLLRFMADNFDLLESLCRYSSHTQGQVQELVQVHAKDKEVTAVDLVQIGLLDADETRGLYAPVGFIKAFVNKLMHKRHLVESVLIESAIEDLNQLRAILEETFRVRARTRIQDIVVNIEDCVASLRESVDGNLEGIHEATREYRKTPPRSSRERWARIRELWLHYVKPMEAIFDPSGPLDEACESLRRTLLAAEERAPQSDLDDFGWARYRLRNLQTRAFRVYREAASEVQPLYDQAKRNAQAALSASAVIEAYRQQSITHRKAMDDDFWDRVFGLSDSWDDRTRKPFGTSIAVWLSQAFYQRPNPAPIAPPQPPRNIRLPLSFKVVSHHFARAGGQADDLLLWLREEFPEASLRETLRAYHHLLKTTQVARDGARRTLIHPEADITSYEIEGTLHGTR